MKLTRIGGGLSVAVYGICGLLLAAAPAHACRYSVREVAFVDLSTAPYRLAYHPGAGTTPEESARIASALLERFRGMDVVAEVQAGSEAARLPRAILTAPSGRTLDIPLPPGTVRPAEALAQALLGSPVQRELLELMPEHLCAAVLVHGSDAGATAEFKALVEAAIKRVEGRLSTLERPMKKGVQLIEIPVEAFERERMVLWSLGIDADDLSEEPRLAAVFGHARRFGPVMTRKDLTPEKLADVFALAGASCECGLDRSWMQGPVVLLEWTRAAKSRVASALGFDPENPLVALEMRQILAQAAPVEEGGTASLDHVPASGYREGALETMITPLLEPSSPQAETAPETRELQAPPVEPAVCAAPIETGAAATASKEDAQQRNPALVALMSVVALLLIVNAVGAVVLWRKKRAA